MKCKVCGKDEKTVKDICGICCSILRQCNQCKGLFRDPKIIKGGCLCNQCYSHALTCSICDHKVEDLKMMTSHNGNYCHSCFNDENNIFKSCSKCGYVYYIGHVQDESITMCPSCKKIEQDNISYSIVLCKYCNYSLKTKDSILHEGKHYHPKCFVILNNP